VSTATTVTYESGVPFGRAVIVVVRLVPAFVVLAVGAITGAVRFAGVVVRIVTRPTPAPAISSC
jgi:hypothetical protein